MKGIHQPLLACFLACFLIMPTPALANYGEPFNYYEPAPSKILSNVEKYHLEQGRDKVRQGKYEYAWSEFSFMLHYFPNHPVALQHIGELSMQMEDPARAERYFERALRLYPSEDETYALYGVFLHKTKRYEEAVEAYTKAIALNDKPVEYHYNLGLTYFEMELYNQALTEAQIAYNQGYPLLGLKNMLKDAKVWSEAENLNNT